MPLAAFPKCFLDALCVTHDMSVDQWVEMSAAFDVDGLEFYWPFTPWRDSRELERIRRKVEAQDRSIPMMCYSPDFTKPDAEDRRAEVEAQKQVLQTCPLLGVRYCRVLSGQRRPGIPRDLGIQWVAECIRELLPEAERHAVTLILENHYKDSFWVYPEFTQRREAFLQLLAAIPEHPHFGVNYDPSNAVIAGEDPIALLEAVKHRVVTMHASDRYFEGGSLKHGVIGQGLIDYDRIFGILKEAGFAGWVSIEDGADPATGARDIAASAVFLRRKMREHGLA
jgi:sugar phosphate isomerase/epimerase